ncbi:tRNA pseudouridine(55) synthase TruB [Aquabacterium sp.]|uniref:tRNA pseudouridine(55) synthase TruB n=1 Tax=Aquabacterium sp. TaxID=1872578 RepID=UPI0035B0D1D6
MTTLDPAITAPAEAGVGGGVRAPRVKRVRRAVHGVLLLDKPLGWSSNDALQKVKWLLRAEKAGHTGTLDPLATGLLPLCFGAATKFSQVSLDADKTYRATLRLGQTTTTGDAEGEVVIDRQDRVTAVTPQALDAARSAMLGEIDQVPPMYSALKHEGKALYEYARAGVEIEREARRVSIHKLDILSWHADALEIEVCCSKGTYVRTLAQDLGEHLGCGAHLTALRRTGSGPLSVAQAVTLDALIEMDEAQREALLMPPDALLGDWPSVELADAEAGRFLSGLRRRVTLPDAPAVRVYGSAPRVLLGSAHIKAGELIPTRLLSPVEVQGLSGRQALPQPL